MSERSATRGVFCTPSTSCPREACVCPRRVAVGHGGGETRLSEKEAPHEELCSLVCLCVRRRSSGVRESTLSHGSGLVSGRKERLVDACKKHDRPTNTTSMNHIDTSVSWIQSSDQKKKPFIDPPAKGQLGSHHAWRRPAARGGPRLAARNPSHRFSARAARPKTGQHSYDDAGGDLLAGGMRPSFGRWVGLEASRGCSGRRLCSQRKD